jgi:hypothetical protein
MTYYDWEKIVKRKEDSELRQILRDNILGEEAYKFAKQELEYRIANKDELSEVSEQLKQAKRLNTISKIIAVYQMIGGVLGILAFIITLFSGLEFELDLYTISVVSLELVIICLSIIAGISLWKRNKYGILLSKINQFLQIVHIKISIFTWTYFSGLALIIGFSFKPDLNIVFKSFGIFTSIEIDWLDRLDNSESFLYLNIISFLALYYLSKIKKITFRNKTETPTNLNNT